MFNLPRHSVFADRVRQMLGKGSIYSLGSSLQLVVSFILIPVYTTYLSTEDYGILSLMTITAVLILTITKTPTATGFIRYFYAPGYKNDRKVILFNSIIFALSNSFVISFIFLIFGKYWAVSILGDEKFLTVIYIYSAIIFLQPLLDISQDLLKMQKRALKFVIMHLLNTVLSAALILYLLLYLDYRYMALIWGTLLSTIFPLLYLSPDLIKNTKAKFDLLLLKKVLKYGYPLILTSLSLFIMEYSDQYIIKYFLGIEKVGLYSFGFKFAFIINLLLVLPMHNIINALIFELEEDRENLIIFVKRIANFFFFGAIFLSLAISLYSKELIMLIAQKREFWASWEVIPALTLAYVFYGAIEISGKGINLAKKSIVFGLIFTTSALINVILGYILIGNIGIQGAAISKLAAFFILNFGLVYYSNKYYGLTFNLKKIALVIISGVFVFVVSLFVTFDNIILSIVIKTIFLSVFVYLSVIFGIFSKRELDYFKKIIGRKQD